MADIRRWIEKKMKNVIWIKCNGEAHKREVDYDHCMVCMPWWGEYPICPVCHGGFRKNNTRLFCKTCRKYYTKER
jgi:hypothetical protein